MQFDERRTSVVTPHFERGDSKPSINGQELLEGVIFSGKRQPSKQRQPRQPRQPWLRQSEAPAKRASESPPLYGFPGGGLGSDCPEYDALKPEELHALMGSPFSFLYRVMAILGIATVRLKSPRIPMLHPYKSTLLVLFPLYMGLLCGAYLMLSEYLTIVANQSIGTDARLISTAKVLYLLPLCFVPVAWAEVPSYFRKQVKAAKYENLYRELTGETITWKRLNLYVKMFAFSSFTTTLVVLYGMSKMPEYGLTLGSGLVLIFGYYAQLQIVHGNVVRSVMLYCMADRLRVYFEKKQKKNLPMSASDLRLVRKLWVSLRDLFDTEDCVFFIFMLIFIYLFVILTLVLYIALSFITTGKYYEALAALATALAYSFELYLSGSTSHLASATMHYPFIRMLDGQSLQSTDYVFIEEINFFYSTVTAKLPYLSLAGYANIDKPLSSSVTSVVVTYLIVLFQFRLSTAFVPTKDGV